MVRPYVDEVVLAVDRAQGVDTLDACGDLVDRRIAFSSPGTGSRIQSWAQHLGSADWVLQLDDDEIPSPALLGSLPELVAERAPLWYGFPRRWLYPVMDSYIASSPWGVEYQYRLVRNVPGLWRFDGRIHTFTQLAGDLRLVELPIYHADALVKPLADRRRKAVAYELERPDHSSSGVPVNGMYLPEHAGELELAEVPDEDLLAIQSVLDAPPARAREGGPPVEGASAAECDAYNAIRAIDDEAYQAKIVLRQPPRRLAADSFSHLEVVVHNRGNTLWPWGQHQEPFIRVGYRWRWHESGRVVREERSMLPETVLPGSSSLVLVGLLTPPLPGEYTLEVDMVHEHVRWFGAAAQARVEVEARPDALTSVGASDFLSILGRDGLQAELDRARGELDAAQARTSSAAAALQRREAPRGSALRAILARYLNAVRRMRISWRPGSSGRREIGAGPSGTAPGRE
jgi:hypothetical protein